MNLNHKEFKEKSWKSNIGCIVTSIHEFNNDDFPGVAFDSWFKKYEDLSKVDLDEIDDAAKVRIPLR